MVKIIDSVSSRRRDLKGMDMTVLDSNSYYPVKLSKQCNVKDIFVGNWRVSVSN